MININIHTRDKNSPPQLQPKENDLRQISINEKVSFAIREIPVFSSDTAQIFENANIHLFGEVGRTVLKTRAENLCVTVDKLAEAETNSTKHKIFCLLKTALITSIIVAGVLGCIALASTGVGTGAIVGVAMAALMISGLLGTAYAFQAGIDLTKPYDMGFKMFIVGTLAGPFFPICEAMNKIPHLKQKSQKQHEAFKNDFNHLTSIFRKDTEPLRQMLMQKHQELEADIINAKKIANIQPAAISDLETKKTKYAAALKELERAVQFYAQFEVLKDCP